MTRTPTAPQPNLSGDGSAAATLRDEVVVRLDTASGAVDALLVLFAADIVAVGPSGRLAAVAGDGEVAVIDYSSGHGTPRRHPPVPAAASAMRMSVDDDGSVVLSSSAERVVARISADGDVQSIDVPQGFHESLVLIPGVGAHLVISGETSLSAIAAFDAGELIELDDPQPQGAVRVGSRLGIYSMDLLRVFGVAQSGAVAIASEHALDGVERVVSNRDGTEVLTVAARWDGHADVLHLQRIELESDKRTDVDTTDVSRSDVFAIAGDGELVRAYGATKPGRLFAVRGGTTVTVDVDAQVAAQRR